MKRIVTLCVGLFFAGCTVFAEGIETGEKILGLEFASGKIEADTFGLLGERNHVGKDIEYGIRFGAQNEKWRTLLILNYFDSSDDDQEYFKGLAAFDYMLSDSSFKPFVGVNVGYLSYSTTGEDESDFIYGLNAGMLFRVSEHFQADIAYRYSFSNGDIVDHTESITLGIDYVF